MLGHRSKQDEIGNVCVRVRGYGETSVGCSHDLSVSEAVALEVGLLSCQARLTDSAPLPSYHCWDFFVAGKKDGDIVEGSSFGIDKGGRQGNTRNKKDVTDDGGGSSFVEESNKSFKRDDLPHNKRRRASLFVDARGHAH